MQKRPVKLNLLILFLFLPLVAELNAQSAYQPDKDLGQLFIDVQLGDQIFPDSKTFVDCIPKYPVDSILQAYGKLENKEGPGILKKFVTDHFILPEHDDTYSSDSSEINIHIAQLWNYLERPADTFGSGSLIPLPYPYIVPGGRFREIYYWDSYFTMLGLMVDGKYTIIRNMIENFTCLLDTFGHIPNGNRSYYLERSQPPFFSLMLEILATREGENVYAHYLDALEKEYTFWMQGVGELSSDCRQYRHVIRLDEKNILNRYWSGTGTPRPESFREDLATAREVGQNDNSANRPFIFPQLRAAAESGWDFSSRWISPDSSGRYSLSAIHTLDIIPVDLNALLYHLELSLARTYTLKKDSLRSLEYTEKAARRKQAIQQYCWNADKEFYMDYDFITGGHTPVMSLAGVYPLFFNIATPEQALAVAQHIEEEFLKPGGVVASLNHTGEQWDAPNGWAPLQWMTIRGLRNYGYYQLADTIKSRWLRLVEKEYYRSYKLLEKYNVEDTEAKGSGGEYPNQDGFGWTNGVYQYLSKENFEPE